MEQSQSKRGRSSASAARERGEPHTYGTPHGCGASGPEPATPLADEAAVDGLRAEVGLPPLADYVAEMETVRRSCG